MARITYLRPVQILQPDEQNRLLADIDHALELRGKPDLHSRFIHHRPANADDFERLVVAILFGFCAGMAVTVGLAHLISAVWM